jgi:redox-sensitive bicupin YhaK (pirin superfamily)
MDNTIQRTIKKTWSAQFRQNSSIHRAGFLLEPGHWQEFDPFLIMAEDIFQKGSFDVHPHRGIETVTYVIDGELEHYDNKTGNGGVLKAGDVQWMTAGRGVVHLEDPAEGVTVHSLQLWINLPSQNKLTEPRYQNLRGSEMPVRNEEGATIRVFSGFSKGITAETKNYVPVSMVEMNIDAGAAVTQDLPGDYNGFFYVIEGEGAFGSNEAEAQKGQILWLGDGGAANQSEVTVRAKTNLKVLLYAGQPVRETVVARGPFVMNSEEEVQQAYQDYFNGEFVK